MNFMKIFTRLSIMVLLFSSQIHFVANGQVKAGKSWVEVSSSQPNDAIVKLVSSDIQTSLIEINISGFWQDEIRFNNGKSEAKVFLGNSTPILIKGTPDMDKLTVSLAIPDLARMEVSILEEEFVDIQGIRIIPSKGNLTRDIDPEDVPYEYGIEYSMDAFFPGIKAELRRPHIIRDVRGQVVIIYPFQYNPVREVLRVYTRLVLEVKSVGKDGDNPLPVSRDDGRTVRVFEGIYERNFLNYEVYKNAARYTPVEEDGNMLIISYGSFMSEMQAFVDWKNMSGIPTEMVNVNSVGSTSSDIKSYVANYYNTNGLTYLLLVGDAAQVPTSSTNAGDSDNDYGYIVGSDHYPDIFVGRFSAENTFHVQTQVERTLDYEMDPGSTQGSFSRAMGIASNQGAGIGDNGEADWEHQRNIRSDYLGFTYTYGAELYDGSQGGQDADGNPNSSMVANELNTGIGIISYTGHGSTYSWSTSGFSTSGVNSLTNNGMLPFILSVACVNGNFVNYTCFGETWMRATHNGEPSGAIAAHMSTINQSWAPPMRGQDEMVDILVETYPNNIKRTFGGICMNGCMNMNDVYGSAGYSMTDTWTIFGDPSLMVRTATSASMTVSHSPVIAFGTGQIAIACDQEGARVAISDDYQLLGAGMVNGGSVNVSFSPYNAEDTLTVTVTAFNCIPSISNVLIMPPGCWLGYTNEWNNPSNWSDGAVPGTDSQVIIPENPLGTYFPANFGGTDPVIEMLEVEDGASISVPYGTTITVGGSR
jgi:hypothetical protein